MTNELFEYYEQIKEEYQNVNLSLCLNNRWGAYYFGTHDDHLISVWISNEDIEPTNFQNISKLKDLKFNRLLITKYNEVILDESRGE